MPQSMKQNEMFLYRFNKARNRATDWAWKLLVYVLVTGISFVILYPLIRRISMAVKAPVDIYNPTIYMVPVHFTLDNIKQALDILNYWPMLGNTIVFVTVMTVLQAASCALAGYGFARFVFPGSNILFMLVVLTIMVPMNTLMVPMYLHFRSFDVLGAVGLFSGKDGINLLNTYWPSIITSALANGLKSGLYIYIFRQFFKGLPKEIEEAALIDGAGAYGTFLRIMMPNAVPALMTVMLFAFVWQYNDTFYASLFMSDSALMSIKVASLPADTNQYLPGLLGLATGAETRADPNHVAMIVDTGILLAIAPLVLMYLFVQRYFVESVERTGVVG
ncbi:carbohydrate ABC transporter permease [Paenibacillus sp. IB182493]|uniref:Carbohydrate ABC transporter permease n=2 Tax=Paenibacillus arenilitoris TaxID=2772299 RepID=A0A927H5B1_9BACL|nr:carbohydrate ABC transporter permease [Paenibacillus arenilitoris]MBD2869296.1 carbohydrate ABC transporter permease [Paenibacillus arenilitoris]